MIKEMYRGRVTAPQNLSTENLRLSRSQPGAATVSPLIPSEVSRPETPYVTRQEP